MLSFLQKARGLFHGPDRASSSFARARSSSLERRKIQRLACHQSFLCTTGKSSWPVTVVDVGFGGFKIRSQDSVGKRGDLLHLRRLSADHMKKLGGSYTTGLMVRVAWSKRDEDGWETGLYLPEAPGSMRIRWYKELMRELGLDETDIFSKRSTRRHRCRLPATLYMEAFPPTSGMLLDLSPGGALLASRDASLLGTTGVLEAQWGVRVLRCEIAVVGVRPAEAQNADYKFLHSLKFEEPIDAEAEAVLHKWLEELATNG